MSIWPNQLKFINMKRTPSNFSGSTKIHAEEDILYYNTTLIHKILT